MSTAAARALGRAKAWEYKQTEIGAFPKDWDQDRIENIAEITTGSRNTQDRIEDGPFPFFVRSQVVERIDTYSFDREAVLTAGDGVGTGKVFHYVKGKFDAHQRVYCIYNFDTRINGYFFFLYFSRHFYSRIMQMTAKSSVDSVRREMIANMLVPIPPRAEQDAVAEALGDADALIESLGQLIAKRRAIKQGAIQELLTGKRRLPGFKGDWRHAPLGKLFEISAGGDLDKDDFSRNPDSSFPYPIYANALTGNGLYGWSRRARHPGNSLTITARGDVGHAAYRKGPFTAIGRLLVLQRKAEIEPRFVAEFINGRVEFSIESTGVPQLTAPQAGKYSIATPPTLVEQEAIADALEDMDVEIATIEAKLAKAQQVKQGMVQELLTGRVRLV